MTATSIEWTDTVWNPTTGCDRVTPGCDHCYAMTLAKRLKGMGSAKYQRDGDPRTSGPGFGITEHASSLDAPLRWRKPRKVFVNSMSDLFHDGVSFEFLADVWAVMARTPQHTYQVLTKRHARMRSVLTSYLFRMGVAGRIHGAMGAAYPEECLPWPLPNVWLGVSVEDQKRADLRIPALLDTPAAVRWLSCEPLLGPVGLGPWLRPVPRCGYVHPADGTCGHPDTFTPECHIGVNCPLTEQWGGIDWLVAGGESGPGARPMHPDWARQLRDQCAAAGVPLFFKQWGAHIPVDHTPGVHGGMRDVLPDGQWAPYRRDRTDGGVHMAPFRASYGHGRELDGRTWDLYPAAIAATGASS